MKKSLLQLVFKKISYNVFPIITYHPGQPQNLWLCGVAPHWKPRRERSRNLLRALWQKWCIDDLIIFHKRSKLQKGGKYKSWWYAEGAPPTKRDLDEPLMSDVDQESNQIIGYYSAYMIIFSRVQVLLRKLCLSGLQVAHWRLRKPLWEVLSDSSWYFVLILSCPSSSLPTGWLF